MFARHFKKKIFFSEKVLPLDKTTSKECTMKVRMKLFKVAFLPEFKGNAVVFNREARRCLTEFLGSRLKQHSNRNSRKNI
jgi:hypothetical protein